MRCVRDTAWLVVLLVFGSVVTALAPATAAAAGYSGAPGTVGGTNALSGSPRPDVVAASAAPGSHWRPEAATYGAAATNDVPVTMSDGTVLRADPAPAGESRRRRVPARTWGRLSLRARGHARRAVSSPAF